MQSFLAPRPPRAGTCVGATYSLDVTRMSDEQRERECQRLTLQAKTSYGPAAAAFSAWYLKAGRLHIPRFYGLARYGPAEHDERVSGDTLLQAEFCGRLTDVQLKAKHAALACLRGEGGCIISLPCGFGKTVLAVELVCTLGVKTVVLVHKGVIRDQWVASFATFAPTLRVGLLQGRVCAIDDCDVVVAMVMTVSKREFDPSRMDSFGFVICDEAHHMAAPVMNKAMRAFRARHVLGLSATVTRADGLTPLLHWSLGKEAFRVARGGGESVRVTMALYTGGAREILSRDGKPILSIMLNHLAQNVHRNVFLAQHIVRLRASGRVIMVLSHRVAQLSLLRDLVVERGVSSEDVGIFSGATKEVDRAAQLSKAVVMCSYQMADEGIDKKEADTLVMATPKARVVQCVGRIQRPCDAKQPPLVFDVADDASVFTSLRWKRQNLYTKEGYCVQVVRADDTAPNWFA